MTSILVQVCILILPPLATGAGFYFLGRKERLKILYSSIFYIVLSLGLAGLYRLCCLTPDGTIITGGNVWNIVCGIYTGFWHVESGGIAAGFVLMLVYLPVCVCCFGCVMFRSLEMKIFSAVNLVLYHLAWGILVFIGSID